MVPWLAAGMLRRHGLGQRPAQRVDDAHAGLDIAGRHRRRWPGIDQATIRRQQSVDPHGPRAGRHLRRHQAAEHVKHGRGGHRQRTVQVARHLVCSACKIHLDALPGYLDGDADPHLGTRPARAWIRPSSSM